MNRRPSTQDLTWILDLNRNGQLDLNPEYQRHSVWTLKDKQFFLDTLFRNYPSPAIFLHKTLSESGKPTYHVVDGKQRLQTILDFVSDKIRISKDYGDDRLNGKKWSEIDSETDLKNKLWDYQITVEQIDFSDTTIVREVFDRLNRNARKLTRQELRHAKYDGWLMQFVEAEVQQGEWLTLGISTPARERRMMDTQFISEILFVVLERTMHGFDQDLLDTLYARYDDFEAVSQEIDIESAISRFREVKKQIFSIESVNNSVSTYSKGFGNFYSLWSLLALSETLPDPPALAASYSKFMALVAEISIINDALPPQQTAIDTMHALAYKYVANSKGASTDLTQRQGRLDALREAISQRG